MIGYDQYWHAKQLDMGLLTKSPEPVAVSKMDIAEDDLESQTIYFKQARKTRSSSGQVVDRKS